MPFHLVWTSPSPIRKKFLHSRGNLIRYCNILYDSSMNNVLKLCIHIFKSSAHLTLYYNSKSFLLSPSGVSLRLQIICLTFWRYWPQHVPCWQRGVQLICTCSGFHYQRNLPVSGRARNLSLLSHRYRSSMFESFAHFTQLFDPLIYSLSDGFPALKYRVLWNFLLPKCLSVPLPPHSRRETTT